jgi:hypothetical protein
MDYLRKRTKLSGMDTILNNDIRRRMGAEKIIMGGD